MSPCRKCTKRVGFRVRFSIYVLVEMGRDVPTLFIILMMRMKSVRQPETAGIIDPYDTLPDQAAHGNKDVIIRKIRPVGDRPDTRPRIVPEGG